MEPEDDNNDVNNADAGGDNKDKSGGNDNKGDQKTTPKDQTYEIVVNGEKRQLTVDEMRNLAQKAAGADKKYEDAANMRKDAQEGLRLKELVTKFQDSNHEPSENEIRELAAMLGVDPAEFSNYLAPDDDGKNTGKDKQGGITEDEFDRLFTTRMGISPAEAQQRLNLSHDRHINDARAEIRRLSDDGVDKDEIFSKIKIGEKAEDRISVIKELVAEDVFGRIQKGEPFGAELIAASCQKVRAYVTKFGIPEKPSGYPITLGLGPSGGLPAEVNSEEPIPRKKVGEDGHEDNFAARWMQKALKKMRDAGTAGRK